MTRNDLRIFSTALGFAVAVLSVPDDEHTVRAKTVGRLIESYCLMTESGILGVSSEAINSDSDYLALDNVIKEYKDSLRSKGSAQLPYGRETLIAICDRLLVRQMRHQNKQSFLESSNDDIADKILSLAEEEIATGEAGT